jgi:hypothetical protein
MAKTMAGGPPFPVSLFPTDTLGAPLFAAAKFAPVFARAWPNAQRVGESLLDRDRPLFTEIVKPVAAPSP